MPVTVNVYVPSDVFLFVLTVNTASFRPPEDTATGFALHEAVALLGRPVTDRLTLPLKPFNESRLTVYVTDLLAVTDRLAGLTLNVKSGGLG